MSTPPLPTTLNLAAVLAEAARKYPERTAVVDQAGRYSYARLWREALAYAGALRALGVTPGDTVALVCPNVADFPRAYFGILAAGAAVVPVHLLLTAEQMAFVLRDSRSGLVVAHTAVLGTAARAAAQAGLPVVGVGPVAGPGPGGDSPPRLGDAGGEPLATYASRRPDDTAVVFYTSGTTGTPKGAELSHFNLVMNAFVNTAEVHDAHHDDVVLGCLPLFHVYGQTVSMNGTFRMGGTVVLLARFTGDAAIDLMLAEGVDVFHGVPQMYLGLLAAAAGRDRLPRLRLCISGGASLPVATLEAFNRTFDTTICEGYGLSETSPSATSNQPAFGIRPGSIGHAIWGVEVEIARAEVEDRIELLPHGELGEIVIRGHNVFTGYRGRPEATAAAVVDGWFRTGDLGTKDGAGFVSVVDRKKDVVIRGGFNVYPREVEEVLAGHPGVAQVAVIGLPDPVHGEEVCAVVVPRPGVTLDPGEVLAWARERLGRHMYPRRLEVVDELPLGPSLKVLKRELRTRFGSPSMGA